MSKTYRIVHREELIGHFYVEADSPEEAIEEYNLQVDKGKIDFSDLEIVDCSDIAEEVNEE